MYITNNQYKLLKYLYHTPRSLGWLKKRMHMNDEELTILINSPDNFDKYYDTYYYSDCFDEKEIVINNLGIEVVDSEKRKQKFFWIPIIIDTILSLTAIVISIISLVASLSI